MSRTSHARPARKRGAPRRGSQVQERRARIRWARRLDAAIFGALRELERGALCRDEFRGGFVTAAHAHLREFIR